MRTVSTILLIALFLASCQAAFLLVPKTDYNKLPILKTTRDFGVNFTLNYLITAKKITNNAFQITANNSIYNQTNGTTVSYKFNLTLANAKKDVIRTTFTVNYNTQTKKSSIAAMAASVKYANTTNTTTTTGSNTGSTNTSTGTTTGSGANTGTGTTTTPPTGYVAVPADQYTTTEVNDSLQYGKNRVIDGAVSQAKIPAGTYTISLINSVSKQVGATSTSYNCSVQIQNADKSRTVNATYVVSYNPSTGARALTSSSFAVLPFKN